MQLIDSIREFFRRRLFKATQESVRDAMKEVSRRNAEHHYHEELSQYFYSEASGINPHDDWWGFADNMQKWHDHAEEAEREVKKRQHAAFKLQAEKTRFARLTKS